MKKKLNIPSDVKNALIGYFSGNLSPADSEILEQWLEKSHDNKRLFDELNDIWQASHLNYLKSKTDVEKAWQEILQELDKKQNEISSAKSKKRIRKMPLQDWWGKVAAMLIMAVILGGVGYLLVNRSLEKTPEPVLVEHVTPDGSRSFLKMPDGSKIWLNNGSTLSYKNTFGKKHREVHLKGEAFFEIKEDQAHPFVVYTDEIRIQVTGTKFLVTCFSDATNTLTYLDSGSIELKVKQTGEEITLTPGDEVRLNKASQDLNIEKNFNPHPASWRFGKISFYNKPLSEIAESLERNFGIDIVLIGPNLKNKRLTAEFDEESIQEIMEFIATIADANIINPGKKNYILKID
mgnify:CR=1 FL=1